MDGKKRCTSWNTASRVRVDTPVSQITNFAASNWRSLTEKVESAAWWEDEQWEKYDFFPKYICELDAETPVRDCYD